MTFAEAIAWLKKQRDDIIWESTSSSVPIVKFFLPASGEGYLAMWDMWKNEPVYFHINYMEDPMISHKVDDIPDKCHMDWKTGSWFALDDHHPAIVEWFKEQQAL